MVLRCGRLLALANAAFITAKYIVFEKEPEKGTSTKPENEPAKNRDTNLQSTWTRTLEGTYKRACQRTSNTFLIDYMHNGNEN